MAFDGVIAVDYAQLHTPVNAYLHSTRQVARLQYSEMDYLKKNVMYFALRSGLETQSAIGDAAGLSQSQISRVLSGTTGKVDWKVVRTLARRFGVSMDDLTSRDIELEGLSGPSQEFGLDLDRLGHALTGVEKALKDSVITGKWGKLAEAVSLGYELAQQFPRDMTERVRGHFDHDLQLELKGEVRGSENKNGKAGSSSPGKDRPASAKGKAVGIGRPGGEN